MTIKLPRGKGKFRGILPIIYFSCNKGGHIASICPNKDNKDENKDNKFKRRRDGRDKE